MEKLILKGWLIEDEDSMAALTDNKDYKWGDSIAREIQRFVGSNDQMKNAYSYQYEDGLGGTFTIVKNASIRFFVLDKECDLQDAELSLLKKLFGNEIEKTFNGDVEIDVSLEGYSEYTITGYCLEKFCLMQLEQYGRDKIGHDLNDILLSYKDKYIIFIFEY